MTFRKKPWAGENENSNFLKVFHQIDTSNHVESKFQELIPAVGVVLKSYAPLTPIDDPTQSISTSTVEPLSVMPAAQAGVPGSSLRHCEREEGSSRLSSRSSESSYDETAVQRFQILYPGSFRSPCRWWPYQGNCLYCLQEAELTLRADGMFFCPKCERYADPFRE